MATAKHKLTAYREELVEEQGSILAGSDRYSLTPAQVERDDEINLLIAGIDSQLAEIEKREAGQDLSGYTSWMNGSQPVVPPRDSSPPIPTAPEAAKGFLSKMFRGDSLTLGEFKSPEDFYLGVYGGMDSRLKLQAAQYGSSDPAGGFSMPSQLVFDVLGKAYGDSIVLGRANVVPMTTREKVVWGFDNSDSSSNLFGGLAPTWHDETTTESVQSAVLTQIRLHAHTMFLLCQSSDELIEDGPYFAQELGIAMAKSISFGLDAACLSEGSGIGEPLAIKNAGSKVEVAKEGAQTANTITYTNLVTMMARLHPACFSNAIWICHPSCLSQLLGLTIGTGENHYKVLDESSGSLTCLSRPLLLSEKMNELGDAFDILLVDLSQYFLGMRAELSIERSSHLGFSSGTTYFRTRVRADGTPRWAKDSAYTPRKGTDTLSWAISLAERA